MRVFQIRLLFVFRYPFICFFHVHENTEALDDEFKIHPLLFRRNHFINNLNERCKIASLINRFVLKTTFRYLQFNSVNRISA